VRIFGFLGAGIFSVVSLVLGVRLLFLWRRTHKLPELLIGSAFLLEGVLTNVLNALERSHALSPSLAGPIHAGLNLTSATGAVCVALVAWKVFRPNERWAPLAVGLCAVLLAAYTVDSLTPRAGLYGPRNLGWWWASVVARSGAHAWVGVEALRYQRMMRRRLRFGLADPVVANRMGLWACAGIAIAVLWLGVGLARTVAGAEGVQSPPTLLFVAVMGVVASITNWLVFLPPHSYVEWIRRRASLAVPAAG
jgi:hypothetical protein